MGVRLREARVDLSFDWSCGADAVMGRGPVDCETSQIFRDRGELRAVRGGSAPPNRSRGERVYSFRSWVGQGLHPVPFCGGRLHDYRDAVEVNVGLTECGDGARATALDGADVNEQHLVFVVVNDARQLRAQLDELPVVELALEDRKLEVLTPTEHELVHLAKTFGVADVIGDDEGLSSVAHGVLLANAKLRVTWQLTEQHTTEQSGLHLEHTAITDAVVENGMGDELIHAPFERHDQSFPGRSRE